MRASVRAPRSRRVRVSRDQYRAAARVSGVKPRLPRPWLAVDAALVALALVFVLMATPRVAGAVGSGIDDFGARLADLFPALQGSKPIDLPTTAGNVNAQLTADSVPDFTRDPQLALSGRVPAFVLAPGRTVDVLLNGASAGSLTPDAAGAWATALTLREGPNAIALALMSGKDVVASSSYTVVLDRTPPTLTVTKPVANATIEGPNVVIEGKAEAGATIVVNDRSVVPAQDGSFTGSFTATPGALTITVVARDRAGNETTVKTAVTVQAPVQTATLVVTVNLDRTRVTPGGLVNAQIIVTANGQPKFDEQVTLSVGVITIGSARTNASGVAQIAFFAPPNEGEASVVVLATGASGRATLTVAK